MPFLEVGKKGRAEERQQREAREGQEGRRDDRKPRRARQRAQGDLIAVPGPMDDGRLCFSGVLRQQQKRESRRHRDSHDKRRQHGEDVGDPEWTEQPTRNAGQRDHRQEHQDHGERGIDDGAADFERRLEHHTGGRGSGRRLFSRSRRAAFSTPITASSTTSPSAIARPPRVIVLSVTPKCCKTATAARSDSGMAEQQMAAVRRSNRNKNRMITTNMPPMRSAELKLSIAVLMKSAGRNSVSCRVTPSCRSVGRISASAAATPFATSRVLAPNCAVMFITTPGCPMIDAPPMAGSGASMTLATSLSVTLAPPWRTSTVCAISSGESDWPSVCKTICWFGVLMKPAPRTPVAWRAAAITSFKPKPKRINWPGRTRIWIERSSPPKISTPATPGTDRRLGRIVHFAIVRSRIKDWDDEVKPAISTVPVEDVRGVRNGDWTLAGNSPTAAARRSE